MPTRLQTATRRVRLAALSLPTYLHYIYGLLRILGFSIPCYFTHHTCLTKVHLRLGGNFVYSFLQILHWLYAFSLLRLRLGLGHKFLQAPLLFNYVFPPLSGLRLDFHQLATDHAGRTKGRSCKRPFLLVRPAGAPSIR